MKTSAADRKMEEYRTVLEAFSQAVKREMHNLTSRPDLLWQQLYNRLQWADGEAGTGPETS